MASNKISQAEADRLLNMLKRSLVEEISLPTSGKTMEFNVKGETKQDIFAINIFKGSIKSDKFNIGARILKDGIMLLELHINRTSVHRNPNGEKVIGSHWHIYSEEHERKFAIPAEDINSEDFVASTILLLEKFKVIEKPSISYQQEMI